MIRERVLEEKKRLNLSVKTMADMSQLRLSKETINRFLTGETADAGVATALDIAATVGLKPYEAFMDATLAAEFRTFLELKSKSEEAKAERIRIVAENETLKLTNAGLVDRIRVLEMQLEHKNEIISLHNYYRSFIDRGNKEK